MGDEAIASWNPAAEGAFDVARLSAAANAVPRSRAALVRGLVAAIVVIPEETASVASLNVLRHLYVTLLEKKREPPSEDDTVVGLDFRLWKLLRVGFFINHPRRLLDPADHQNSDAVDKHRVPPPSEAELNSIIDTGEWLACAYNDRGTSCFVDTPTFIMFVATDAFDDAVYAKVLPDKYRTTPREYEVMGASDDVVDWCMAPEEEGVDRAEVSMRANEILQKLGHAVRARAATVSERTDARKNAAGLVNDLRDVLGECLEGVFEIRKGVEDMGMIYDTLIPLNGWSSWFTVPIVAAESITHLEGVPLPAPIFKKYEVAVGPTSMRVGLRLPNARPDSTSENLQALVHATVAGVYQPTEKVVAGDKALLRQLEAQGGGFAGMVQALRGGGSPIWVTVTSTRFVAYEPRSRVIVFDATALSNKWGSARVSTYIDLPHDRVVDIPIGKTGQQQQVVQYRVFAVAIREATDTSGGKDPGRRGGASSGHYWCYFWRGNTMFGYNDGGDAAEQDILWRVEEARKEIAMRRVRETGLLFFAERYIPTPTEEGGPPPGSPVAGRVAGITDAEDWNVWSAVGTRDNVVQDLGIALPRLGSYTTIDGNDIIRLDLASVFPGQFMTAGILDMYGGRVAAEYGCSYMSTHDMQQIYAKTPDSVAHFLVADALSDLNPGRKTIFIPVTDFRGTVERIEAGTHWSLLMLRREAMLYPASSGDVTAMHYDSKGQPKNTLVAWQIVENLQRLDVLPKNTILQDVEGCVTQPKETAVDDPAGAACGPIVLGFMREAIHGGSGESAANVDRRWRLKIIDDIIDKSTSDDFVVGNDETPLGKDALRRLLVVMRFAAEKRYLEL